MRFRKVDLAWLGNKSAKEAVDRAGGEVFARTTTAAGEAVYHSLLLVHQDSPLRSLDDVLATCSSRALTFGNGDPNSTSGSIVPGYFVFSLNNVQPHDCFRIVTTGDHESNLLSVASGRVDVTTFHSKGFPHLRVRQPEMVARVRPIWQSPPIPTDPLVWRKALPAETKAALMHFFMQYGRAGDSEEVLRERAVLHGAGDGWGPFRPSSDLQLLMIRKLELENERTLLEAKANGISSADRSRLAEITAALSDIADLQQALALSEE